MLDSWRQRLSNSTHIFKGFAVRESKFVLAICTPQFRRESDTDDAGVAFDAAFLRDAAVAFKAESKIIPILRRGDWSESTPTWLRERLGVDLRGDPYSDLEYDKLRRALHGQEHESPRIVAPSTTEPLASPPTIKVPVPAVAALSLRTLLEQGERAIRSGHFSSARATAVQVLQLLEAKPDATPQDPSFTRKLVKLVLKGSRRDDLATPTSRKNRAPKLGWTHHLQLDAIDSSSHGSARITVSGS